MKELLEKRTRYSKTFDLGNGKRLLRTGRAPRHFMVDGALVDIDTTPKIGRNNLYEVDKAPYALRIDPQRPAYLYTSESGQWVEVELVRVGEKETGVSAGLLDGGLVKWAEIAKDTDLVMSPLRRGIETLLFLHSPQAPKLWRWRVRGNKQLLVPPSGRDALGKRLELVTRWDGDDLEIIWTGRAASRWGLRHKAMDAWQSDIAWPVRIDPTVNESITAGSDDVGSIWNGVNFVSFSSTYGLQAAGHYTAFTFFAGLRFQTVAVPQGATIDSATLTINVIAQAGTPNLTVYGDDVDDAPAWANPSSRIKDITKTTASANVVNPGTGLEAINVQSIVQEIVNRVGWASNNDMRFGFFDNVGGNNIFNMEALEAAGTSEADLDITYTAAGSAGQPAVKRMGGVPFAKHNRGVW
jgi:hypothetical protein